MAVYKVGSSGDDVKALQTQLKNAGFDPGGIDGQYGSNTAAAVLAYQKANNLTPDSIAGPQTLGSLTRTAQSATPASTVQSPIDKIASEEYQWGKLDPAYKNAIQTGTEDNFYAGLNKMMQQPVAPQAPSGTGMNLSGLSNINFGAPVAPEPYKDPYADKINSLLDKYLGMGSFSYDPSSDAGLEAAQGDAMAAVDRNAARRGMIYSDSNKSQLGKSALSLIPQFRDAARSEYQSGLGNIINQLQTLQGLSNTGRSTFESDRNFNYDALRDTVQDTGMSNGQYTQSGKINQQSIEQNNQELLAGKAATIAAANYDNIQAYIDKLPANDPLRPFLQAIYQKKIEAQKVERTKAEQEAYDRATGQEKFELDKKYTNAQISNLAADNARQAEAAAEKKASSDAVSSATPEQLNYFNNAFNYLLNQNGGDGYKAYQQLLREGKDYNASMGTKLFTELGKQLQGYGKSQGSATSMNKPEVYKYEEDTGYKSDLAGIYANPSIALQTVKDNAAALIDKYGPDGYNALLAAAKGETPKKAETSAWQEYTK